MSTIPYDDPITSLKDKNPDVLVLKTNVGDKQIPNVAWLAGYVDNKITGGGGALDSYLTKNEASTTYAAISNVYSKTDADNKFMLKTDTPNMDGYLPLTAGSNKALTGSLYTSAATPYLIGTAGKVGIRANRVDGSTYASQVALSYTNAELSDPYFINMVANASSEKQTSLRLGVQDDGTYGLTYKEGDQIYNIYHEGNLDLSDITTEGAVPSEAGDYRIKNTTNGIYLTSGTEAGFVVAAEEAQIWGNDTLYFTVKPTGAYITDINGDNEYQIVDESMILTATEVANILNA